MLSNPSWIIKFQIFPIIGIPFLLNQGLPGKNFFLPNQRLFLKTRPSWGPPNFPWGIIWL